MSIMLVSTEDAKLFLGLKTEDEHDDLIELIIEQVSARIETYLNRELKAEERTKYFDAGKNSYSLPAYPVDTGETFTVNHDDVELTIDEDYYLHDEIGVVEFPLGTGEYNHIHVIVPDGDGGFQVATGGVYSYYEFWHPRADRLTDEQWWKMIEDETLPDRPAWVTEYLGL